MISVNSISLKRLSLVSFIIIIIDQATKYLIQLRFDIHQSIIVIDNFFSLTHILNPGGAFGFFAGQSLIVRKFIFIFLSTIVACFVLYIYFKTAIEHLFLSYGFALIFAGAVGNLIDRIRYGKVIDFLDFYIGSYHWPAFNVADSAISIGMVILVYHIVFNKLPDF